MCGITSSHSKKTAYLTELTSTPCPYSTILAIFVESLKKELFSLKQQYDII